MPRVSRDSADGSKKVTVADKKKVQKQIKSAVQRIQSGEDEQSAQQLSYFNTGKQSFNEQDKARGANPFASAGRTILSGLSRLGQANMQGLQQFNQAAQGASAHGLGALVDPTTYANAAKGYGRGLTDISGQHDINAFQMLNLEKPDTKLGTGLDLATQIVLDPTTFVGGLGAGAKAKQGLKIIEESLGKDTAKAVAEKGFQNLPKAQKAAVRTVLKGSEDAARAKGDNALVGAYRNLTGRSARSGAEKFTERLIGNENELASIGKLVDAQGLSAMGKTLAPGLTFGSIGKATGITNALGKARNTGFATKVVEAFKPRAAIAAGKGERVAELTGAAQKAARAAEYQMNDADVNAIKNAIGKGTLSEGALKVMDRALDEGTVGEAIKNFRKAGDHSAAKTLKVLDQIRKRSTERLVTSGLAEHGQLRDVNKYLHRSLSPEAEKWIERNKDQAARILGFQPTADTAGLLKNVGPQFRKLDPNAAVQDLNKTLKETTGIDNFFVDNPIQRVLTRSSQINHGAAIASLVGDLSKAVDDAGNPLMVAGQNSAKRIKQIEKEVAAHVKDLTKEHKQLSRFEQRRAVQAAALRRTIDGQQRVLSAAKASRQALERKISKLTDEAVENLDKARKGAPAASKATSAMSRAALDNRIKGLRTQIKAAEAAARKGEKNAGELRKLRDAEKRALAQKAAPLTKALRASVPVAGNKARAALRIKDLNEAERKLEVAVRAEERARERLQKLADSIPEAPVRTSKDVAEEISTLKRTMRAQTKLLRDADKAHMAEIRKLGYQKVDAGPLGEFWAPGVIADEIAHTSRMLQDDDALKAFGKIVGGATQAWKNLALNTIVLGTGTSARNAVGNLMLMWTAGYKDVSTFVPATKVVRQMRKLEKAGKPLTDLAKNKNLTNWERWAMKNAIRDGVVGGGFNRTDLAKNAVAATKKQKIVQALDVRRPESLPTRHMSVVNQEIEDTSRLAFYFDALRQTGNPRVAARMTEKALIDYQDITNVERKIKLVIPFYTFMSRNLAIQAYALGNVPGRVNNIQRVRDAIFEDQGLQNEQGGPVPDYVLENGQLPFTKVGDTTLFGTVQSPFDAAAQVVQPISDLASRAPGVSPKYQTEAGVKGGLAGLASNIGGAPGSLAKQAAGEMTGVDPYTGAPLKEGESTKRLVGSLVPILSRSEALAKDTTGDSAARREARILSTLGVTATANDDARQKSEMYRRLRELGASGKRQGIPTATELKKQGKLKKSGAKSKGAYNKKQG